MIDDLPPKIDRKPAERFNVGITAARLFLDVSKDEFTHQLVSRLGAGGVGIKRWNQDRELFLDVLIELGLLKCMKDMINYPVTWSDLLTERLKGGRGSAIKGQSRGRGLEDFAEALVKNIFGKNRYVMRCNFIGKDNRVAKCDIAIPGATGPSILIEAKGYGATGSKQSDIIGDLEAIAKAKRHDTNLLFVTDGVTWNARQSDLAKIINMQNRGEIFRVYTKNMEQELIADLTQMKIEHGL